MLKINVCVNTTKSFSEKTIPIIVDSLLDSGIDSKNIFVIEGGYETREVNQRDSHTHIFTNHNSLEYTGLIDIVEYEMESDYWFNIHDTCKVGKNFKKLLYNIPEELPDKIALRSHPSMSIGSYKYSYLLKHKSRLLDIKNTDYSRESLQEWKQRGIGMEDYMLYKLEDSPTYGYNPEISDSGWNIIENEDWYKTNIKRRIEYHPTLDLYKSKSNWNVKSWMEIDL
jgi:hypothetical protein